MTWSLKSTTGVFHSIDFNEGNAINIYYVCNRAVGSMSPLNVEKHKVTCKNCLRGLNKK